jgi:hypothetical protein
MQVGSLVECVADFSKIEEQWNVSYPKQKEILTITNIAPHPNAELRTKEIVLLEFDEYPDIPGLCDKTEEGVDNFVELQPPMDNVLESIMMEEATIPSVVFY